MIAFVKGRLVHKEATHVIIEANGIGYHINISLTTYAAIKNEENCMLHTFFHVKEDAQTLYGFLDTREKAIFTHLISISGVGPSTGMMVLSTLSPEEVVRAIVHEDVKTIQSVKGIGAKSAQRIILELKDKLSKDIESLIGDEEMIKSSITHNTTRDEALTALITLGIPKATAEKNVDRILKQRGTEISVEEIIKLALKTA